MRNSPAAGGYDFAADPNETAEQAQLFWTARVFPEVIEFQPLSAAPDDDPTALPIDLTALPAIAARTSPDGAWHGLWQAGSAVHRFWLPATKPAAGNRHVVILPFDRLFKQRLAAAERFWRTQAGLRPMKAPRGLPGLMLDRHALILRALDARLVDGASYRLIGEVLLGFHGSKADWESHHRKSEARRLVEDGLYYKSGGYRELLCYPLQTIFRN